MDKQHDLSIGISSSALLIFAAAVLLISIASTPSRSSTISMTMTEDRLAQPPLPKAPSQYETGRYLYWLNCMPCHGDQGQGLTDEFRSLWVEDHQNCWGRGCHGGRTEDQGFPLPHNIPGVISSDGASHPSFSSGELFEYLRTTHPPQHPGYLPDEQYWALSNYLLVENDRLQPTDEIGPVAMATKGKTVFVHTVAAGFLLLACSITLWLFISPRCTKPTLL